MKKTFLKFSSVIVTFLFLLLSCTYNSNGTKEIDINIDEQDYIIKFSMNGPMLLERYIFILTPDNEVVAGYINEKNNIEKIKIPLNEFQLTHIKYYSDKVLSLSKQDIECYVNETDQWVVNIEFGDVTATFDYGASDSSSVNILLEQIIGCCDSEKSLKTKQNLQPFTFRTRKMMSDFSDIGRN